MAARPENIDLVEISRLLRESARGFSFAILLFISLINVQVVAAPAVSQQMIEQLRGLPVSERDRLARQFGVDVTSRTMNTRGVGSDYPRSDLRADLLDVVDGEAGASDFDRTVQPERGGLPRYGARVFDRYVSTFAPLDNVPIPEAYRLSPGDTLNIMLYGKEQLQESVTIDREGDIHLPRLGSFSLVGLSVQEAQNLIKRGVSRQMIGTEAIVSMGRLRSITVFMAGEVRTPGSRTISGLSTLTQALYNAGGITDIGSLRNIEVRRRGEVAARFDLYDLMFRGDATGDVHLLSGDVVLVPPVGPLVGIDGPGVRRPGWYELEDDETVDDLIGMAGGIDNRGFLKNVRLTRYEKGSVLPRLVELDLMQPDQRQRRLIDGDLIEVDAISEYPENAISLKGAVARPGLYAWNSGVRVSDFIRDPDSDLLPETDLKVGLIVRRRNARREIDVLSFQPERIFSEPGTSFDSELRPHDELVFLPRARSKSPDQVERKFTIKQSGQVDKIAAPIESDPSVNSDVSDNSRSRSKTPDKLEQRERAEQRNGGSNQVTRRERREPGNRAGESESFDEEYRMDPQEDVVKHSRTELLAPVIARLKEQSSPHQQVAVVEIGGAVRVPGEYPLLRSRELRDLLDLAGGLENDAFLESIEIRRVESRPGESADLRILSVDLRNRVYSESDRNVTTLQSRDYVRVNSVPDWNPTGKIVLEGEVLYPGEYLILPGEKLGSIIERAGGLTDQGFPNGAVFTRQSVQEAERQELESFANSIRRGQASRSLTSENIGGGMAAGTPGWESDFDNFIQSLLAVEVQGRLVIDLNRILGGDSTADIEVHDGDSLVVPPRTNSVTIVGEVYRPGSFRYESALQYDDYLELAAGVTPRSDRGAIFIVKANGRVQVSSQGLKGLKVRLLRFGPSEISIHPGDTIVVPTNNHFSSFRTRYTEISTSVFQSIATMAAVLSIQKK